MKYIRNYSRLLEKGTDISMEKTGRDDDNVERRSPARSVDSTCEEMLSLWYLQKREAETTLRTHFCFQLRKNTQRIYPSTWNNVKPGQILYTDGTQDPAQEATAVSDRRRQETVTGGEGSPTLPRHCVQLPALLQGGETQAESDGLPELRTRSWESGHQGTKSLRTENERRQLL